MFSISEIQENVCLQKFYGMVKLEICKKKGAIPSMH